MKTRIYEAENVPEYWIVNLKDERLERHTGPIAGGYQHVESVERGTSFALAAFPDIEIAVADLLP